MIFSSSRFLTVVPVQEPQKLAVKVQKIDEKKAGSANLDYAGAVVPNQKLDVVAKEVRYTKVEDGEYYDYIDKVVKKNYRYNTFEVEVARTAITTNSEGIATYTVPDKTKTYAIEFISTDEAGRKTVLPTYHSGNTEFITYDYLADKLQVNTSKEIYSIGEKDSTKLTVGNTPAATGANISYLFIRSQNGITDFLVTNDNKYEFTFEEKDAPNYTLSAASFNGKFYQKSQKDAMIRFNY